MNAMGRFLAAGLALVSLGALAPGASSAQETALPPAALEPFALEDQHGVSQRVDAMTRAVLFSADMDAGDLVKAALQEGGAERLARAGAVYVSDVSRMPGIVRRTMAEPAMRKRPYPILLDREGDVTKGLPRAPGQVTLLVLDGLRVVRTETLATADALMKALDALPAAPAGDAPAAPPVPVP
jgi:hypothetical protein